MRRLFQRVALAAVCSLPAAGLCQGTALGTTQIVVVCVSASASAVQGVCPDGYAQSVASAYLVSASEAGRFELAATPFDPVKAGEFFGFGLVATIFIWSLAWGAGQVIALLK